MCNSPILNLHVVSGGGMAIGGCNGGRYFDMVKQEDPSEEQFAKWYNHNNPIDQRLSDFSEAGSAMMIKFLGAANAGGIIVILTFLSTASKDVTVISILWGPLACFVLATNCVGVATFLRSTRMTIQANIFHKWMVEVSRREADLTKQPSFSSTNPLVTWNERLFGISGVLFILGSIWALATMYFFLRSAS